MTVPGKIMLIRHGEKPPDEGPPYGIDENGGQDSQSLTVRGWERAGALVPFFAPPGGQFANPLLATPQSIYACGSGPGSESKRHMQTAIPLAEKLGLTVNTRWLKGQEAGLAEELKARPGVVLIVWEHKRAPHLANLILGNDTTSPQAWPSERYDVVWVFDWDAPADKYRFAQVPELLLAGDSTEVL